MIIMSLMGTSSEMCKPLSILIPVLSRTRHCFLDNFRYHWSLRQMFAWNPPSQGLPCTITAGSIGGEACPGWPRAVHPLHLA